MLLRRLCLVAGFALVAQGGLVAALAGAVHAQANGAGEAATAGDIATAAQVDVLFDALALSEIIAIMREEGIAYGHQIRDDMFPGQGGAEWAGAIEAIYDATRMEAEVRAALVRALDGRDVAPMIAFFEAEPGASFIRLEVSARRAMLDDAVEAASKEVAGLAMADATPRFALVQRIVEANDLIETNVVGAMNANFAFYLGMMDANAFGLQMGTDEMLASVWAQEDEIRASTTEWVYSFLLMAYQPLTEADLEAYIAFSETQAGRDMNRAMFAAFDGTFDTISRALGAAAARFMVGEEL